jgi:hypothetical protein
LAFGAVTVVEQRLPPDLKDWTLEYLVTGGIDGRFHLLTLKHNGLLIAEDRGRGKRAQQQASAELLAKVAQAFQQATMIQPKASGKTRPIADAVRSSVKVTAGGVEYVLRVLPDFDTLLQRTLNENLQRATDIGFDPGKRWKVLEGRWQGAEKGMQNAEWESVWVRRGDSLLFDATFRNRKTNETIQDVIELKPVQGRELLLYRQGRKQYYRATYLPIQPERVSGHADWQQPGDLWFATIEY